MSEHDQDAVLQLGSPLGSFPHGLDVVRVQGGRRANVVCAQHPETSDEQPELACPHGRRGDEVQRRVPRNSDHRLAAIRSLCRPC